MSRIPTPITLLPFADQAAWLRRHLCESQTLFWSRFGVTQSQGSRYEQGGDMPMPVALLLLLYVGMHVSDTDLLEAGRFIRKRQACQLPALRVAGSEIRP